MALRVILDDCRPALFALAAAMLALIVVIRSSGCRFDLRRLVQLHRCQRGGVQRLSFVLTLPIFVMLVMFIVQVSQLMIAQVVINYATYGAARSIAAWVPQHVTEVEGDDSTDPFGEEVHFQNMIRAPELRPGKSRGYNFIGGTRIDGLTENADVNSAENMLKLEYPHRTAVTACATISPSRHLGLDIQSDARSHFLAIQTAWQQFAGPDVTPSTEARLYNKFCYSYWNTEIWIRFQNLNSHIGPTHNPLNHPTHTYVPNEIGWRDPITVTVRHNLALLPGPGRFLAKFLVRPGGPPDLVSHRINKWAGPRRQIDPQSGEARDGDSSPHDPKYNNRVYTTTIWSRATVTNDGVKSLVPYVHAFNANR